MDYALIACLLLAFGMVMYVVLDGFDLGIGILLPFARDAGERERMIASVAPVWDGNETWLVLRGVAFEYRPEARWKGLWSVSFGAGSLLERCTPTGCSAARPP